MTHTITDEQLKKLRDLLMFYASHDMINAPVFIGFGATTSPFHQDRGLRAIDALAILCTIEKQPAPEVTVLDDADLQEEVCSILSKYGVEQIYDAETEILYALSRNRKAPTDAEVSIEDIVQEITYHLNKARCLEKRLVGNHELASRIFESLAMKGYIRAATTKQTTPEQQAEAELLEGMHKA